MEDKTFSESQLVLKNRTNLSVTGVERIYETNESKIQLKVAGSILTVCGEGLNVSKLDVDTGVVNIEGKINDLKYAHSDSKGNFFKKLFK